MIPRAQWGSAHDSYYRSQPRIGVVSRLVIHHTASPTLPSSPDAAYGYVRSMESYGGDGRWIEYHGVVDQFGQVFEGYDVRSQGAHCNQKPPGQSKSFNSTSLGLCLMGYFYPPHNHEPTAAQLDACARWVADRIDAGDFARDVLAHAIDPNAPGWRGHRETGAATACPGTLLDSGALADMMGDAAALVGATPPDPGPPTTPSPTPPSGGGTLGPYPLPGGHWYGPDDSTDQSHSGVRSADRPNIERIQTRLMTLGFELPRYGADGWYGTETGQAVGDFQDLAGDLSIDGLVGPQTWSRL